MGERYSQRNANIMVELVCFVDGSFEVVLVSREVAMSDPTASSCHLAFQMQNCISAIVITATAGAQTQVAVSADGWMC